MISKLTDEQLLQQFSAGNQQAVFYEIVKRYKERVYYHVRKIVINHDDADDAAQNTFIKVWENLPNFRGDSQLFSWIYRIASNEALMLLRKKKPNINIDDAMPELAEMVENSSYLNGNQIAHKLAAAVHMLPEKQRNVFNLKYYDDLSYEQIAEITGNSIGTLKANYHHAVTKLQEFLQIKPLNKTH